MLGGGVSNALSSSTEGKDGLIAHYGEAFELSFSIDRGRAKPMRCHHRHSARRETQLPASFVVRGGPPQVGPVILNMVT